MTQLIAANLRTLESNDTSTPTILPSFSLTPAPTAILTVEPTTHPSLDPTFIPTTNPSIDPTLLPTTNPTELPTAKPSVQPTSQPSFLPTSQPYSKPTSIPSEQPIVRPTAQPTVWPTTRPSEQPTSTPTERPSEQPTSLPTGWPSQQPVGRPTDQPTNRPTERPSEQPTSDPTEQPSEQPTSAPTAQPSQQPSSIPTDQPTNSPTNQPSNQPSCQPTILPTAITPIIDLGQLITEQGISITGEFTGDSSGWSVSGAGDFNKDGYDDVVIGAYSATTGVCYVIFGNSTLSNINIANDLSNTQGFSIIGANPGDLTGYSVRDAGDVNGDKISDIIIGAPYWEEGGDVDQGISYVIYGQKSNIFTDINLLHLTSSQGFFIKGASTNDCSGWSVSKAGDVNHDGYDDVIIGAPYASSTNIGTSAGISYIIFGKIKNVNIELEHLLPNQAISIVGIEDSMSGYFVSAAGDVNGDGYDDVIIGAPAANFINKTNAGASYIVFGSKSLPSIIFLGNVTEVQQGFYIMGANSGDNSGASVGGIGDFNKDGFSDVIIGAPYASPYGTVFAGSSYVVYGKNDSSTVYLETITAGQGFPIFGSVANSYSGWSVSGAGDVNNDTYADIIIGAPNANSNEQSNSVYGYKIKKGNNILPKDGGQSNSGVSYVVYGKAINNLPGIIVLGSLTYAEGYELVGVSNSGSGRSVSGAGDFNGDNQADVIVGAPELSAGVGASYVIINAHVSAMPSAVPTPRPTPQPTHDPQIAQNKNDQFNKEIAEAVGIPSGILAFIFIAYNLDGLFHYPVEWGGFKCKYTKVDIPYTSCSFNMPYPGYSGEWKLFECSLSRKFRNVVRATLAAPETKMKVDEIEKDIVEMKRSIVNLEKWCKEHKENFVPIKDEIQELQNALKKLKLSLFNKDISDYIKYRKLRSGYDELKTEIDRLIGGEPGVTLAQITTRISHLVQAKREMMDRVIALEIINPVRTSPACIDASIYDPEYAIAFAKFSQDLMVVYEDFKELFSSSTDNTQKLLIDSTERTDLIAISQKPTTNKLEFSTSDNLIISLCIVRQLVEYIPLIKYVTQGIAGHFNYNITLPEVLDNKALLITTHLVLGSTGAQLLPSEMILNGMIASTISSSGYAMRLTVTNYLKAEEVGDNPTDMLKQCGVTMLAYTLPNVATCMISKLVLPDIQCAITSYDILASSSLGVVHCYSSYKTVMQPSVPTAIDVVVPYMADSVMAYMLSGYVMFDASSAANLMLSIKNSISLAAVIVATDYIVRSFINTIPNEFKKFEIERVLEDVNECYMYGIDNFFQIID